ncbi:uncharacterized protein [Nicotiana sylvestris]|uniref:uncharacterized protein n=1 Tax=Nicotiana sylvestris TaxID=4096 RepID=UPI00388CD969
MVLALRAKRKLEFIDGSCTKSQFTIDLGEDWERVNTTVLAWIMNIVSSELITRLCMLKMLTRLKSLWDEYGSLIPSLLVTARTGDFIEYLEQQKIFQFLMGLNESYEAIRSQILLQSPSVSVSRAFAMLINEKNQRKVYVSNSQISLANEMNESTIFMNTRGNQTKFKRLNDLYYEYCHFKGH